ncbi:MAG TPA: cytidine deaminase [bacterium (Candidatus Stahlbacteria)]|nr:cytidine deaminase [Candidatus Stahlbacteria bacterium]
MARTSSKQYDRIIESAKKAARAAYAPYSKIRVGAAVRTRKGKIFTGCNVENASLSLTLCAERNAIGSAIAAGESEFTYLVLSSPDIEYITPCGCCAQFLAEFNPDIIIITTGSKNTYKVYQLKDILAIPFKRRE